MRSPEVCQLRSVRLAHFHKYDEAAHNKNYQADDAENDRSEPVRDPERFQQVSFGLDADPVGDKTRIEDLLTWHTAGGTRTIKVFRVRADDTDGRVRLIISPANSWSAGTIVEDVSTADLRRQRLSQRAYVRLQAAAMSCLLLARFFERPRSLDTGPERRMRVRKIAAVTHSCRRDLHIRGCRFRHFRDVG